MKIIEAILNWKFIPDCVLVIAPFKWEHCQSDQMAKLFSQWNRSHIIISLFSKIKQHDLMLQIMSMVSKIQFCSSLVRVQRDQISKYRMRWNCRQKWNLLYCVRFIVLQVWPDLAKFHHFGKNVQVFVKTLIVYWLFGKMVNLLWQICDIIGPIFIATNGKILKNNLTSWWHW